MPTINELYRKFIVYIFTFHISYVKFKKTYMRMYKKNKMDQYDVSNLCWNSTILKCILVRICCELNWLHQKRVHNQIRIFYFCKLNNMVYCIYYSFTSIAWNLTNYGTLYFNSHRAYTNNMWYHHFVIRQAIWGYQILVKIYIDAGALLK